MEPGVGGSTDPMNNAEEVHRHECVYLVQLLVSRVSICHIVFHKKMTYTFSDNLWLNHQPICPSPARRHGAPTGTKMSMATLGAARRIRVGALTAWLEMILMCTKWGYRDTYKIAV